MHTVIIDIKYRVIFTTGKKKLLYIWKKNLLYIYEWMHTAIQI